MSQAQIYDSSIPMNAIPGNFDSMGGNMGNIISSPIDSFSSFPNDMGMAPFSSISNSSPPPEFDSMGRPYGPNNPPPVLPTRSQNPRDNGVISEQKVPERDILQKALARQLTLWSPESNLLEAVYPDTVLKMILPYGVDAQFRCRVANSSPDQNNPGAAPASEPAYAVGILCWNLPIGGMKMFNESEGGVIARVGYHYQQIRGELLATLAMAKVASDYEIRLRPNESLTVADLVETEKKGISFLEDHSMAAIGLSFYISDASEVWTGSVGQSVSLLLLADYELNRPVYWNRSESVNRLLGLTFLSHRFHQEANRGTENPEFAQMAEKIDLYLQKIYDQAVSDMNNAGLRQTRFLTDAKIQTASDMLLVNGHLLRWQLIAAEMVSIDSAQITKSIYHLALTLAQFYNPQTSKLGMFSPNEIEAIAVSLQAIRLYQERYPAENLGY